MPLGPGAYIAEEVLPWIDASGKLVAATGARAVGTPAPSGGGSLPPPAPPPPDVNSAGAQPHPVQPKAATPHAPVVNVRQWRELEDRDEPYNPHRPPNTHAHPVAAQASPAHPTALLMGHSHAKVVAEPTHAHGRVPLGNLSQTMKQFNELGAPHPTARESTPRRNVWGGRGPAPRPISRGHSGGGFLGEALHGLEHGLARAGHELDAARHEVGKFGELLTYPLYYLPHRYVHHSVRNIYPANAIVLALEAAGLTGDILFDKLEGAPAGDEHRRGSVPIFHGHFIPGYGHGHLDYP